MIIVELILIFIWPVARYLKNKNKLEGYTLSSKVGIKKYGVNINAMDYYSV